MQNSNIISVSWGDHLMFGENEGRLDTPEALVNRMVQWRDELSVNILFWRYLRTKQEVYFDIAPGYTDFIKKSAPDITWDEFEVVPRLAHDAGLSPYLYVSLFDEGWPLLNEEERKVSYHNSMHKQHVSWQTNFSREHPNFTMINRYGKKRHMGVLCLAYPEVRKQFRTRFCKLLAQSKYDGLFVCLRSQSRPADFADEFGFNKPIQLEFEKRYGVDIIHEDFNLQDWRDLLGDYLTIFIRELRNDLNNVGCRLALGVPRGEILGPPMGNTSLQWKKWIEEGIIDELVINQNSSQCPSLWHQLWPMHRGNGYIQNYLTGENMLPLNQQLVSSYKPVIDASRVGLYVARQWDEKSKTEEVLFHETGINGLVFSSFRFDNPEAIARGDWRA